MLRRSVKRRAGFDIETLNPIEKVEKSYIPAFLIHASNDTFVGMHHSKLIHDKYAGDKKLVNFEGIYLYMAK